MGKKISNRFASMKGPKSYLGILWNLLNDRNLMGFFRIVSNHSQHPSIMHRHRSHFLQKFRVFQKWAEQGVLNTTAIQTVTINHVKAVSADIISIYLIYSSVWETIFHWNMPEIPEYGVLFFLLGETMLIWLVSISGPPLCQTVITPHFRRSGPECTEPLMWDRTPH